MNDSENRRRHMFTRVAGFGQTHADDFAPDSLGKQLFTTLEGVMAELDELASSEAAGIGSARQGTATREQARSELRADLEAIRRTARAMADEVPGLDDKFRMPPEQNDRLLLNAARAFEEAATPIKAQFIAHEMPADFVSRLSAHIAALDNAILAQSSGVGHHVAANAAVDDTVSRGVNTVRKLDAIVKNKYADNSAVLAEWTSASHTERAPQRAKPGATPPPPPPTA
jgi:hypothetical protein